jgi:predicted metal-dependent hydrolase
LGEKYDFKTKESNIHITVKNFESEYSQNFIEDILTQIYRFEAKKILPPRLNELARHHNFKFNKVTIRNNKRNWGSCSSKNNISLNLQMMKLPDELIDYILLHELVHTEIKNHSTAFWKKLNQITNNHAKELAKQVKQYSTYTL